MLTQHQRPRPGGRYRTSAARPAEPRDCYCLPLCGVSAVASSQPQRSCLQAQSPICMSTSHLQTSEWDRQASPIAGALTASRNLCAYTVSSPKLTLRSGYASGTLKALPTKSRNRSWPRAPARGKVAGLSCVLSGATE